MEAAREWLDKHHPKGTKAKGTDIFSKISQFMDRKKKLKQRREMDVRREEAKQAFKMQVRRSFRSSSGCLLVQSVVVSVVFLYVLFFVWLHSWDIYQYSDDLCWCRCVVLTPRWKETSWGFWTIRYVFSFFFAAQLILFFNTCLWFLMMDPNRMAPEDVRFVLAMNSFRISLMARVQPVATPKTSIPLSMSGRRPTVKMMRWRTVLKRKTSIKTTDHHATIIVQ